MCIYYCIKHHDEDIKIHTLKYGVNSYYHSVHFITHQSFAFY